MIKGIIDKIYSSRIKFTDNNRLFKTELYSVDKNDLGEDMFTYHGKNNIIIGGRIFLLEKLFNIVSDIKTPTLNTELGIADTHTADPEGGLRKDNIVCLLGVGVDGAGETIGSVNTVDIKTKGFDDITDMIPFRLVDTTNSEPEGSYYMRKTIGDKYAYYLKPMSTSPVIRAYFKDGTEVTSDVWQSTKTLKIDAYIELQFEISSNDLREYFEEYSVLDMCRYNSICLYAGYPEEVNGRIEYKDVRAITKLNIENEPFTDYEKNLKFIYRIYLS